VACSFHDDTGESVGKFSLAAGDDAARVKWVDASEDMKLHGSHNELVSKVCHLLNAHCSFLLFHQKLLLFSLQ